MVRSPQSLGLNWFGLQFSPKLHGLHVWSGLLCPLAFGARLRLFEAPHPPAPSPPASSGGGLPVLRRLRGEGPGGLLLRPGRADHQQRLLQRLPPQASEVGSHGRARGRGSGGKELGDQELGGGKSTRSTVKLRVAFVELSIRRFIDAVEMPKTMVNDGALKKQIPLEAVAFTCACHLLMSAYRLVGFGWLPLLGERGTVVRPRPKYQLHALQSYLNASRRNLSPNSSPTLYHLG